jgi:putative colanic acid biosynthesis acetyltransferase WcaF
MDIDLSKASLGNFKRTKPRWYEALWIFVEFLVVTNPIQVSSRVRRFVLRLFGGKIGQKVIIRPRLRVKFPWNLEIGDRSWIGEGVWIHNQDKVFIGSDSVISQETFITTGSHEIYKNMDLIISPVHIGNYVWITTRCIVLKGVVIGDGVVVTPGSVVNKSLLGNAMYGGNPARFIKNRLP